MRVPRTGSEVVLFLFLSAAADVPAQSSNDESMRVAFEVNMPYLDGGILTSSDPTVFESIEYRGRSRVEYFYDGRLEKYVSNNTYGFRATFRDDVELMVHVNSEFKDRDTAERAARKYAVEIGRLPHLLRREIKQVHINDGYAGFSAAGEG